MNGTNDNLSDDFGLAKGFEKEGEGAGNDEDENGLNYEEREGVVEGIIALPDPIRRRFDGSYVKGHMVRSRFCLR